MELSPLEKTKESRSENELTVGEILAKLHALQPALLMAEAVATAEEEVLFWQTKAAKAEYMYKVMLSERNELLLRLRNNNGVY